MIVRQTPIGLVAILALFSFSIARAVDLVDCANYSIPAFNYDGFDEWSECDDGIIGNCSGQYYVGDDPCRAQVSEIQYWVDRIVEVDLEPGHSYEITLVHDYGYATGYATIPAGNGGSVTFMDYDEGTFYVCPEDTWVVFDYMVGLDRAEVLDCSGYTVHTADIDGDGTQDEYVYPQVLDTTSTSNGQFSIFLDIPDGWSSGFDPRNLRVEFRGAMRTLDEIAEMVNMKIDELLTVINLGGVLRIDIKEVARAVVTQAAYQWVLDKISPELPPISLANAGADPFLPLYKPIYDDERTEHLGELYWESRFLASNGYLKLMPRESTENRVELFTSPDKNAAPLPWERPIGVDFASGVKSTRKFYLEGKAVSTAIGDVKIDIVFVPEVGGVSLTSQAPNMTVFDVTPSSLNVYTFFGHPNDKIKLEYKGGNPQGLLWRFATSAPNAGTINNSTSKIAEYIPSVAAIENLELVVNGVVVWRRPFQAIGIISRSQWGADAPKVSGIQTMASINGLTFHHSSNTADGAEEVRRIQDFHMSNFPFWGVGRDYDDIGYHFLVSKNGSVYEGRSIEGAPGMLGGPYAKGSHVDLNNTAAGLGICMLGDYEASEGNETFSAERQLDLEKVISAACRRYRIAASNISYHKIMAITNSTECPGSNVIAKVSEVVQNVGNNLQ